eukprot:gene15742-18666_t
MEGQQAKTKSLGFKVRAVSKEGPGYKAANLTDPDLRTCWSSGTNNKEWVVLELEESSLLSHIRIHNKSVSEWEISLGLRFKPDSLLRVRPRCEAPRRDATYPIGHLPCRFVRINCLRGSPIAICCIQFMGLPVPGLEPEFTPVVEYLLPHIVTHIREPYDANLQLLRDVCRRLGPVLPHLQPELAHAEAMEESLKFFAMLVGPFYPILMLVTGQREADQALGNGHDSDAGGAGTSGTRSTQQKMALTVSSNFAAPPKKGSRGALGGGQAPRGALLALQPEVVLSLLRHAHSEPALAGLCRKVAFLLHSRSAAADAAPDTAAPSVWGQPEGARNLATVLGTVEEAALQLLFASAAHPAHAAVLAGGDVDLAPFLPLLRVMLPTLRPAPDAGAVESPAPTSGMIPLASPALTTLVVEPLEKMLAHWRLPGVERALARLVALASGPRFRPLLEACAPHFTCGMHTQEMAACVLVDLCTGPLADWLPLVVPQVDVCLQVLLDLLPALQGAPSGGDVNELMRLGTISASHSPLVPSVLALLKLLLSGALGAAHVQALLDAQCEVLFLLEMMEPALEPLLTPPSAGGITGFGHLGVPGATVAMDLPDVQKALTLLRTALAHRPILPALEHAWRAGHVSAHVLLSILAPHLPIPACIVVVPGTASGATLPETYCGRDEALFAAIAADAVCNDESSEAYSRLQVDYLLLHGAAVQETRSQQYIQLAQHLCGGMEGDGARSSDSPHGAPSEEGRRAAVDALLLAAECYLNPLCTQPPAEAPMSSVYSVAPPAPGAAAETPAFDWLKSVAVSATLESMEEARDVAVLRLLLRAAELQAGSSADGAGGCACEEAAGATAGSSGEAGGMAVAVKDAEGVDVKTLVRAHQAELGRLLLRELRSARRVLHEVLLHGLLCLLRCATELPAPAQELAGALLLCAAHLNTALQVPSAAATTAEAQLRVRRLWTLLRQLVEVCCTPSNGAASLLPASAWLGLLADGAFASSPLPLVRYIGWFGTACSIAAPCPPAAESSGGVASGAPSSFAFPQAAEHTAGGPLVAALADTQSWTTLLAISLDEMCISPVEREAPSVGGGTPHTAEEEAEGATAAGTPGAVEAAGEDGRRQGEVLNALQAVAVAAGIPPERAAQVAAAWATDAAAGRARQRRRPRSCMSVIFPELMQAFPRLHADFCQLAARMLQAVGVRIARAPAGAVPSVLAWFSQLCAHPPALQPRKARAQAGAVLPGARRAYGAMVLHVLQSILSAHLAAVLPEAPRLLTAALDLCHNPYADAGLVEAVLSGLQPVLASASVEAFEDLCFDQLQHRLSLAEAGAVEPQGDSGPEGAPGGDARPASVLLLFVAATLARQCSPRRQLQLLQSMPPWLQHPALWTGPAEVATRLRALQLILEACHARVIAFWGVETGDTEEVDGSKEGGSKEGGGGDAPGSKEGGGGDAPGSKEGGGGDAPGSKEQRGASDEELKPEYRRALVKVVRMLSACLEAAWCGHPDLCAQLATIGAKCLVRMGSSGEEQEGLESGAAGHVLPALEMATTLQTSRCWRAALPMLQEGLTMLPAAHRCAQ